MRTFVLFLLFVAVPILAAAQQPTARDRLIALMSESCAVGEPADRFRTVLSEMGPESGGMLVGILIDGAPASAKTDARAAAATRYAELQDWLKDNADTRAGQLIAAGNLTEESYIGQAVDSAELTYRENALRGLAFVDAPGADAAIRQAVQADSRLSPLGTQTLGLRQKQ